MKIKIMFIIHNAFGVGGVQKILNAKANGFAQRNFEVVVYSANSKGDLHFDYDERIVLICEKLKNNGLDYFLQYKKSVQNQLKEHQPTHVFVLDNGLKGLLIPFFTTKETQVFYERHGEILVEEQHKNQTFFQKIKNHFYKKIYRVLAKNFNALIVLTDEMALEWQHPKIMVLPNPVVVQINKNPDLQAKVCVFCGRFSPEKGFENLFLIWKKALLQQPDWQLFIFTNQVEEVKKMAQLILNLNENSVQVFPFQKDLNEVYPIGSILLSTSLSEGFPVTIVEALTFGLPVVAFDCDFGPRKLIINNQNGFLIPVGQREVFIEKLNQLQNDFQLRCQFSESAINSNTGLSIDEYLDKILNLF
ncbi:MAG: glycosyltransferase [Flavobacterium sp.]